LSSRSSAIVAKNGSDRPAERIFTLQENENMADVQEKNKEIVRRFNRVYVETGDQAVYDEIVSPDFKNYVTQDAEPGNREEALQFYIGFRSAFPDVKVIIHDQFADGDVVVTRKAYQGTHSGPFMGIPATNKHVTIPVIDIIRLRGGQYVEHWGSADMMGLMQQLKG